MRYRRIVHAGTLALLVMLCILGASCRPTEVTDPSPLEREGCQLFCDSMLHYLEINQGIGDYLHMTMDDQHWPVTDCGGAFSYYRNHKGGTGDTLQIVGCNGGVHLTWAYRALWSVKLRDGWVGTTDRGIRIGSTLSEVRAAYPEVEECTNVYSNRVTFKAYCVSIPFVIPPYRGWGTVLAFQFDSTARPTDRLSAIEVRVHPSPFSS